MSSDLIQDETYFLESTEPPDTAGACNCVFKAENGATLTIQVPYPADNVTHIESFHRVIPQGRELTLKIHLKNGKHWTVTATRNPE